MAILLNGNCDNKDDGKILDPFMGSGTLPVVCEKLNKEGNFIKATGIKLEEKWFNVAKTRLEEIS